MKKLDRNRLENDVVKELHSSYEAKKVNGNEIRFRSISNYEGDKTPSAYFNTTKKFFKDFSTGEGGGLVTLAKLLKIDLNNYAIKDNNETNENKTFIDEKLKNYWKNRGIKKLPNSITTNSNKNIAYYLTYNTPEKETLFQYCYMSDTSTKNGTTNKAFKRLNKKGEAITNLYIPYEWEYYKPKQENNQPEDNKKIKPNVLYICEGVSDCLTLNHCGYKAIAIRSKGSLTDRKGLTKSELKKFIDETRPERVIVIPDPDGYKEWKKHFTKYFTEWQYNNYSFIDIKLYTTKDIKIDSNELFRFSDYDVKSFRQRLYWLLNQSTTIDYGTIFKNYPKKCYEGYNKKGEIIPVSNFIMIFRKIYTDKNTKYEYEKTEVTFINDRINKTIILDSNNFVYAKFESIIKSLGAELWISKAHLNEILKLEIQYRQLKNRIEYYDKFGHIEDDLVLFKNVAFYKGKPYFQTSDDYIEIGNKIVQCVSQDAPELKIGCKDDVNKLFVETLTKAYGFNGILALAYNLGSVRMKPVIDKLGIHPINYAVGTKGVGKSKMFDYVLKLFGTRTHKLTGIDTATSIRRTCAKYNYLPVIINEFDYRNTKYSDLTLFLCDAYDRKIRGTAQFTNDNSVRESSMNAFINISSNEMPENTHKLFRRSFYIQMLQKDLNKSYRIDLDNFAEQSNIIYKLYQLDLDVINLFNDYDLMLKQNDINDPNIHIPYYIGFEILRKLNLITEDQFKEYCNQLLFLARKQDKDLSVNNDVIKFIEFMHLLSCEEMRRDKDDSHNTIIHTTIMPNKHYAIRGDSKKYMILNINLTMEIVNSYCRKNGHKTFDLKVFKGALSECDFFDNSWTDNKKYDKVASIGGDKVRTWRLDLEKLEELGFTFRETPVQSVEEVLASAFDEYEEPLPETVEVTAENVNEMEDLCLSLTRKDRVKAEKLFKAINTYFGKNRAITNQREYEAFVRFFTIKVEKIAS